MPHSLRETHQEDERADGEPDSKPDRLTPQDFSDKIAYAFQLATHQGPLCNEPMQGVAVILEDVTINAPEGDEADRVNLGRLTGEVIKATREAIREGFLDWSPRILLAMYSCEIQASGKPCVPSRFFLFSFPAKPNKGESPVADILVFYQLRFSAASTRS